MNPFLLEDLHDIEGLDAISSWPLATGWWICIALAALFVSALVYLTVRRLMFLKSWKNDTVHKLAALEKNLSDQTARETALLLSEYLRRVALKRFSRKECAALMGEKWLIWLSTHDPKQFDWEKKGMLLIEVPYSPTSTSIPLEQIKDLIQAVKEWVR